MLTAHWKDQAAAPSAAAHARPESKQVPRPWSGAELFRQNIEAAIALPPTPHPHGTGAGAAGQFD